MPEEQWIIIPRWDEFQHRDMARSTVPPWIKNMTKLLGDTDYLRLSCSQRGLLHGIWLMYAGHRRVVNESEASRVLVRSEGDARHWKRNLKAIVDAGFIELSASRPASRPASLEVEVERERFTKTPKSAREAHAIETMIRNGVILNPVDLTAELAAAKINGDTEHHLRRLLAAKMTLLGTNLGASDA